MARKKNPQPPPASRESLVPKLRSAMSTVDAAIRKLKHRAAVARRRSPDKPARTR